MEISAEKFLEALEKNLEIPRVIIIWGEEDYYKEKIIKAVLQTTFTAVAERDREINVFDRELPLKELETVINSYPFFSGKNMVVIKNPKMLRQDKQQDSEARKEQQVQLAGLLTNVPDFCQIVCAVEKLDKRSKFYKTLLPIAAIVESKAVKSYNLRPWLDEQAVLHGCIWEYGAAELVIEYMAATDNVPLLLLANEIEKLAIYAGARKKWTRQDVEAIFSELPEVSIFALTNAIAEKKTEEVLSLLAVEEKRGTNILKVNGIVSSQIRKLWQVKELAEAGYDKSAIANELKMHPFIAQKTIVQSKFFTKTSLQKCLMALGQLNIDLRKGGRKFEQLEEILVMLLHDNLKRSNQHYA
ncbi:MAG: DNA polymerase III subunit delta [Acidaminococcaceae bacterium]